MTHQELLDGLAVIKSAKSKREALKLQINFRRKVLGQHHKDKNVFLFSHGGRQHTLAQLSENLLKLLPSNKQALPVQQFIDDPSRLVNKRIEHLFDTEEGDLQWYNGTVIKYDQGTKQHRVVYDTEDTEYFFNLLDDIRNGELFVYDQ